MNFIVLAKLFLGAEGCSYVSEFDIRIVFVLSGRPLRLHDINTGMYEGSRPNGDAWMKLHEGLYKACISAHTSRQLLRLFCADLAKPLCNLSAL